MKSPRIKRPRKRRLQHWPRAADDFYCEPEWCAKRLFEVEKFEGRIWDPACGKGNIVRAAHGAGYEVVSSDLVPRGFRCEHVDFLICDAGDDNIVCNPPFALGEKFVAHALRLARRKVAILLPANWLNADKRSRWIEKSPLRRVYFITPRPTMPPGNGVPKGREAEHRGLADYAWLVWLQGYDGRPEICWLRRDGEAAS
jgi:hypothetical protein